MVSALDWQLSGHSISGLLAVWHSGNMLALINIVAVHPAWLALELVLLSTNYLQADEPSRCITSHTSQLSLAILHG